MMSKTAAEPLVRISKREGTTFVQKVLVRAIAILLALVVDAFFIFFVTGQNPISVYGVMWNGTFMNTTRFSWALRDLSSLLCIAIALAPAFKMRFWNIGGEGQVFWQQPARTAAVCRHGHRQCAGRCHLGLCSGLVQIPLEHQRNAVHPDDELRCH